MATNNSELPVRVMEDEAVEDFLATPTQGAIQALKENPGDVLVLGAGGKMGATTALMAAKALDAIGEGGRVVAVSRFSDASARKLLEDRGIETLAADLMDRNVVAALPEGANVLFLAGQKFGTTGSPELTWALNTLVPANVAERYADSKIVAFSSGCAYPFVPVNAGGSRETDALCQTGDYPNSVIARERIFEYSSKRDGTKVALFRLNYAIDLRYGVLVDVAGKVLAGEPVDVTTGHVNVIWQGDACARAIQCLSLARSPAVPINITGPEVVSVRALAHRFGELFGKEPVIAGEEAGVAWLSDASESFRLFGHPTVSLDQMVRWVADWLLRGGRTIGKPTHFEVRDGKF